jgi:hypothetical protein
MTDTDRYVTGGTYSNGIATLNNSGGTNVNGFSTGGATVLTYWSAGTGTNSLVTKNAGNTSLTMH